MYSRPETSDMSVVTEKLKEGMGVGVSVGVGVTVGASVGLAVAVVMGEDVGEVVGAAGAQLARRSSNREVIPISSRFIGQVRAYILSDGRIRRKMKLNPIPVPSPL